MVSGGLDGEVVGRHPYAAPSSLRSETLQGDTASGALRSPDRAQGKGMMDLECHAVLEIKEAT